MADNSEYRELLRVHQDVNKLNDFLHLENARLREAMHDAERLLFEFTQTFSEDFYQNRYTKAHISGIKHCLRLREKKGGIT